MLIRPVVYRIEESLDIAIAFRNAHKFVDRDNKATN